MKLKTHYPWDQTEKGQGFFVPCIDTAAVRTEGLNKALGIRLFDARAKVGIRDGFTGVWFYRLP
jgi:hypothetical protein